MRLPFMKASPVCELGNIYYAVSAGNIVVLAECALRFRAYPPRQRWVRDGTAYRETMHCRSCSSTAYPPRQRWVRDVKAYRETTNRPSCSIYRIPTSSEVGS